MLHILKYCLGFQYNIKYIYTHLWRALKHRKFSSPALESNPRPVCCEAGVLPTRSPCCPLWCLGEGAALPLLWKIGCFAHGVLTQGHVKDTFAYSFFLKVLLRARDHDWNCVFWDYFQWKLEYIDLWRSSIKKSSYVSSWTWPQRVWRVAHKVDI